MHSKKTTSSGLSHQRNMLSSLMSSPELHSSSLSFEEDNPSKRRASSQQRRSSSIYSEPIHHGPGRREADLSNSFSLSGFLSGSFHFHSLPPTPRRLSFSNTLCDKIELQPLSALSPSHMYEESKLASNSSPSLTPSSTERLVCRRHSLESQNSSSDLLCLDHTSSKSPLTNLLCFKSSPRQLSSSLIFDSSIDAFPSKTNSLPFSVIDTNLLWESFPCLMMAVIGLIMAGFVLGTIQNWPVLLETPELFIVVPVLLNLKGNLEMSLAARLSTCVNDPLGKWPVIVGNVVLLQIQALSVGFIASFVALVLGFVSQGKLASFSSTLLVFSVCMSTASLSALIIGTLMIAVVLTARATAINPDNIAIPIASSFGDLTTLLLLGLIGQFLYPLKDSMYFGLIPLFILSLLFLWCRISLYNEHTQQALKEGWIPILISILISSLAGLLLERFIDKFKGLAIIMPVINGVGGNLASIYSSRYSTALQSNQEEDHIRTKNTLLLLNIPILVSFIVALSIFHMGGLRVTLVFSLTYIVASFCQVAIMLFVAQRLVRWLWNNRYDPDNCALPFITSLGDVLGTSLLVIAFNLLWTIRDSSINML